MAQLVKLWPVTDTVHQYWRLCCKICPNLKAFYRDYHSEKLVWDYLNSQQSLQFQCTGVI